MKEEAAHGHYTGTPRQWQDLMTTLRIHRRSGFAHIPNDIFNDQRLSFRALGVLTYLLSKPDNWVVNATELKRSHAEGRDAVRTALQELSRAGYIVRSLKQGSTGKIEGMTYDVNEVPTHTADWEPYAQDGIDARKPGDGFPGRGASEEAAVSTAAWEPEQEGRPDVRKPGAGKPGAGFPGALLIPESTNTEREVENEEQGRSDTHNPVPARFENRTVTGDCVGNGTSYSTEFEIWWMAYGRKGNKVAAYKRWKEAASGEPIEQVIEGTKRYIAFLAVDGRRKQDAERWLRDRGWESKWEPDVPPAVALVNGNGHKPITFTQQRVANSAAAIAEFDRMAEEQERRDAEERIRLRNGTSQPLLRARVDAAAHGDVLGSPEGERRGQSVPPGRGRDH